MVCCFESLESAEPVKTLAKCTRKTRLRGCWGFGYAAFVSTDVVCMFEAFGLGAVIWGRDGSGVIIPLSLPSLLFFALTEYEHIFLHFCFAKPIRT
jgi:hypothetical protein